MITNKYILGGKPLISVLSTSMAVIVISVAVIVGVLIISLLFSLGLNIRRKWQLPINDLGSKNLLTLFKTGGFVI